MSKGVEVIKPLILECRRLAGYFVEKSVKIGLLLLPDKCLFVEHGTRVGFDTQIELLS